MSKRLSVSGKAFFLLKTGARIWVEVFLIFCAAYSAEGKFIWEFLYVFPAVCTTAHWYGKQHTAATNTLQGPEPAKFTSSGHFFPPSTSRTETWNTFPHYIFHWRQVSLMMQETDMKGKTYLCSSLNFCTHCISEEGKNRDFCFPAPGFLCPFCCSHWHCANVRIHIHHVKGSQRSQEHANVAH